MKKNLYLKVKNAMLNKNLVQKVLSAYCFVKVSEIEKYPIKLTIKLLLANKICNKLNRKLEKLK